MNRSIEEKVEAALSGLTHLKQAEPKPFLLTRVRERLQQQRSVDFWQKAARYIARPVIALPMLALLLLLNAAAVASKIRGADAARTSTVSHNDFAMQVTAVYDLENHDK